MPAKPTKYGIKVFVLAEAPTGYVYRFFVYTGKEEGAEHGLCTQSVITLMEGLEGKGHILYTDNYYSSPTLFKYLYERGIYACGTFRPNRKGVPSGLKVKNLPKMTPVEKGYNKVYSKDEMVACVWKDKKNCLSSVHIPHSTPW